MRILNTVMTLVRTLLTVWKLNLVMAILLKVLKPPLTKKLAMLILITVVWFVKVQRLIQQTFVLNASHSTAIHPIRLISVDLIKVVI